MLLLMDKEDHEMMSCTRSHMQMLNLMRTLFLQKLAFIFGIHTVSKMTQTMANESSKQAYTKHFIPLESDPELFTELIHNLGASESLQFQDVYSIDDPELLAFVPKPVYALILILPITADYAKRIAQEDTIVDFYSHNDKILWLSQTINNACGLYAILHAIANSDAKVLIGSRTR
jgi:hypothetical protein